eukprot:scaffold133755_cov83-Attheya_sp.AAC.1
MSPCAWSYSMVILDLPPHYTYIALSAASSRTSITMRMETSLILFYSKHHQYHDPRHRATSEQLHVRDTGGSWISAYNGSRVRMSRCPQYGDTGSCRGNR